MKYAYITITTNKHFGKIKKKHFAVNSLYDTKLCGYNTVYITLGIGVWV